IEPAAPIVRLPLLPRVFWLAFPPPPSEEPPIEDFAVVVLLRSDPAANVTPSPSTVLPSIDAVVSPNTTATATAAPALPALPSASVVAFSLLVACSGVVFIPVACMVAPPETISFAVLSNTVTATAASLDASLPEPGAADASIVTSDLAVAPIVPLALRLVDAPWINTSGSASPPTIVILNELLLMEEAFRLPSTVAARVRSPAVALSTESPTSIFALEKLVTSETRWMLSPRLLLIASAIFPVILPLRPESSVLPLNRPIGIDIERGVSRQADVAARGQVRAGKRDARFRVGEQPLVDERVVGGGHFRIEREIAAEARIRT